PRVGSPQFLRQSVTINAIKDPAEFMWKRTLPQCVPTRPNAKLSKGSATHHLRHRFCVSSHHASPQRNPQHEEEGFTLEDGVEVSSLDFRKPHADAFPPDVPADLLHPLRAVFLDAGQYLLCRVVVVWGAFLDERGRSLWIPPFPNPCGQIWTGVVEGTRQTI